MAQKIPPTPTPGFSDGVTAFPGNGQAASLDNAINALTYVINNAVTHIDRSIQILQQQPTFSLAHPPQAPSMLSTPIVTQIDIWEDDPFGEAVTHANPIPAQPITVAVPAAPPAPLQFNIVSARPDPIRYPANTEGFRFWTAQEALSRGIWFWMPLLPPGTRWSAANPILQVTLVAGQDFNANYSRNFGLRFYSDEAGGLVVYSGESPDVACHELGHAILDSFRPELFNAAFTEAAAFHESFGDMSSILSALQLPSMRQQVLEETNGQLERNSRLSRLAEQLGWAIRQSAPQAVDTDCLRNAANRFFYRPPTQLPPQAPATLLSSEAHSFSRVFTGAFFQALAGMLVVAGQPNDANLLAVSRDMGQLLVDGVRLASVTPAYFAQVAASMIKADQARNNGKYRNALAAAFIQHGILVPQDLAKVNAADTPQIQAAPVSGAQGGEMFGIAPYGATLLGYPDEADDSYSRGFGDTPELPIRPLGDILGIGQPLAAHAPETSPRLDIVSAAQPTTSADDEARAFVEDLVQLGRIEFGSFITDANAFVSPLNKAEQKTHTLARNGDSQLVLKRIHFDCLPSR